MKRLIKNRQDGTAMLFIIPSLILVTLFIFYPMAQSLITSFQTGVGNNMRFTGIVNYTRLLSDKTFHKALVYLYAANSYLILLRERRLYPYENLQCCCSWRYRRSWN